MYEKLSKICLVLTIIFSGSITALYSSGDSERAHFYQEMADFDLATLYHLLSEERRSDRSIIDRVNKLLSYAENLENEISYKLKAMGSLTNLGVPDLDGAENIALSIVNSKKATEDEKRHANDCLEEINKRR